MIKYAPVLLCFLCLVAGSAGAQTSTPGQCAPIEDDHRRLACYDQYFQTRQGDAKEPLPAPSAGDDFQATSQLSRYWELSPESKTGTFTVKTYQPNYLLPVHWTSSLNRSPYSPTHQSSTPQDRYRSLEAKFQISLRAKVAEDLFLPHADLWLTYTQRSLWQLWNSHDSAPFRNTDYQPEAIYIVPLPAEWPALPGGWRWRMAQLGWAHQSNGQSTPLSRSWNRVYGGVVVERENTALSLRHHQRVAEQGANDNPDRKRLANPSIN